MDKDFDLDAIEKDCEESLNKFESDIEQMSRKGLVISLFGPVNAGKSSTINALLNKDYASVKPIAGWTKEVSLYELAPNVYIADTPGLYDINKEVSKKAEQFVEKNSDLILFFISATEGLTLHVKESFESLKVLNRDIILVLNKIDALDESEVPEVLEHIEKELGIKPRPTAAKRGVGIKELSIEIADFLKDKGKDLLYLKQARHKEHEVKGLIKTAAIAAATVSAIPIPGFDIAALIPIHVTLSAKIAYVYGIRQGKGDIMKLLAATVYGSASKKIVQMLIQAAKVAGWIPGAQGLELVAIGIAATVNGAMTWAFGVACNEYYKSGMTMDMGDLGELFNRAYEEHRAQVN
jgi:GTP-binding protein Era